MKNLDSDVQRRILSIAKKNLKFDEEYKTGIWLTAMPIYKFISKAPFLRSFLISFLWLFVILITNIHKIDGLFLAKQISLAIEVLIGFYACFYFIRVTDDGYYHLSQITILPRDTFQRWFAEHISRSYGKINLLPLSQRKNYKIKDVIKNDREVLIWFVVWIITITPILFLILKLPEFSLKPGVVSQYIFVFLWSYSWLWTPHWVIFGIIFLIKFAKLPVRYFYGIPNNLTLKGVGAVVVRLNYGAFAHFVFLIPFLYFWEVVPHSIDAVKNMSPIITAVFLLALAAYVFVSSILSPLVTQIAIAKSMLFYRNRKLAEYANYVEEAFNKYMRSPSEQSIAHVKDAQKNIKIVKTLPVIGLTPGYFLIIFAIFLCDIVILTAYFKISFNNWATFFYIFRNF